MKRTTDHFGQWLKRKIQNRLMTVQEFAEKCDLDQSTLFRIFGQRRPRLRALTIVVIALHLELPREEIERRLGLPTPAAVA
jgi:predicted transcriptional regulator